MSLNRHRVDIIGFIGIMKYEINNGVLISIKAWFEWTTYTDTDILCLFFSELCKLCIECWQMKSCYMFICNNMSNHLDMFCLQICIPIRFGTKYTSPRYRFVGALCNSVSVSICVVATTLRTNDGVFEQATAIRRPFAINTRRFASFGQTICSTCARIRSQRNSGVCKLACK